jgi:hypothetical protein
MEIMQDIAQDGLSQAKQVTSTDSEDDQDYD